MRFCFRHFAGPAVAVVAERRSREWTGFPWSRAETPAASGWPGGPIAGLVAASKRFVQQHGVLGGAGFITAHQEDPVRIIQHSEAPLATIDVVGRFFAIIHAHETFGQAAHAARSPGESHGGRAGPTPGTEPARQGTIVVICPGTVMEMTPP